MLSQSQTNAVKDPPIGEMSIAVDAFCHDRQLLPELQETAALILEHFTASAPLALSVETDSETGDRWLEISVAARGIVSEIAEARRRYNRQFLRSAPAKIRDNVRLHLHIAPE